MGDGARFVPYVRLVILRPTRAGQTGVPVHRHALRWMFLITGGGVTAYPSTAAAHPRPQTMPKVHMVTMWQCPGRRDPAA
jgi:hypothetical protein